MRTRRVQDKAWAIDLHLVKHSGMGKAAAVLGGEKVDLVGSNPHVFISFRFARTHLATDLGEGWLHFGMRMIAHFWALAMVALQTARCWAEDGCLYDFSISRRLA